MNGKIILDVRGLSLRYPGASIDAVSGLSFLVEKGEIFGIVGESGSGKSTLAKALLGMLPRDSRITGEAVFDTDNDLARFTEKEFAGIRGKRITMVNQNPANSFDPLMRISTQFRESLLCNGYGGARKAMEKRMAEYFDIVRLDDPGRILDSYPHQLSGGQLQRVALAFALAVEPDLLIADEPTSSLDVTIESRIIDLLARLKARLGITVLLITHNLDIVRLICGRVCVMENGVCRENGRVEDIFNRPSHPYTKKLINALESLK